MLHLFTLLEITIALLFCQSSITYSIAIATTHIKNFERIRTTQASNFTVSESSDADDDEFQSRHKRKPKNKDKHYYPTPSPTLNPTAYRCVFNGYNNYGDLSDTRADVSFTYEIEVESYIFTNMSSEVIPAVEKAIADSLARAFFRQCGNDYRSLKTDGSIRVGFTSYTHRRRSLELQGITSNPPDVFDDKNCESTQTIKESMCARIVGGLSLYMVDGSEMDDVEATANEAILFVRENMKGGLYLGSHEGMLRMKFVEVDMIEYNESDSISIRLQIDELNQFENIQPTFLIITGMVFTFLLIAVAVAITKIRNIKSYDSVSDSSDNESNGQFSDLTGSVGSDVSIVLTNWGVPFDRLKHSKRGHSERALRARHVEAFEC